MPSPSPEQIWSNQQTLKSLISTLKNTTSAPDQQKKTDKIGPPPVDDPPHAIASKYSHILKKISKLKVVFLVVFIVSNLITLLLFVATWQSKSAPHPPHVAAPKPQGQTLLSTLSFLALINSAVPAAATAILL